MADFTWRAGKSCFAKFLHFVGFTFLPFYSLSFSLSCSLSHTQSTHSNAHTHFLLHYKNILPKYFTIVTEFILLIWVGKFTIVRKMIMLKPLKRKCWRQTFLLATGNEPVSGFEVHIISRDKKTLWWVETDLTVGFLVNSSHLWFMKLYSDSWILTHSAWLLSHSALSMALYQQL